MQGQELWRRYTLGEKPANDAEAGRFEAWRRIDQEWSGYFEERDAYQRYAAGHAPRDEAEHQWFARFAREVAASKAKAARRTGQYDADHAPCPSSGARTEGKQRQADSGAGFEAGS